jgi:hypothetical protein
VDPVDDAGDMLMALTRRAVFIDCAPAALNNLKVRPVGATRLVTRVDQEFACARHDKIPSRASNRGTRVDVLVKPGSAHLDDTVLVADPDTSGFARIFHKLLSAPFGLNVGGRDDGDENCGALCCSGG